MTIPNLLSIAGSDPSGGAGIQADLKSFGAFGCYGMAAITALTAQNTQGVQGVEPVSARFVEAQLRSIFDDITVDAVKIGMLANVEIISAVAQMLRDYQPEIIVLDPVMVATSGDRLLDEEALDALKSELIPLATIITPNIPEAVMLLSPNPSSLRRDDIEDMAQDLADMFDVDVLLKGGHLKGKDVIDVLVSGEEIHVLEAPRVDTLNTHGTGCTLSSALAALLACGLPMAEAAAVAKDYLTGALEASGDLDVGKGHGPVQHFWELWGQE